MFDKINNVSHTLIINTFEGFYYRDSTKINDTLKRISESYKINNLLDLSRKIAKSIKVEILNESKHVFEPFGDSSSFLVGADVENYNTGAIHLKESHITFHTYLEDKLENFFVIRFELHICSCTDENIFLSLPEIFGGSSNIPTQKKLLNPHLIGIDYFRRGSVLMQDQTQTTNKNHILTNDIFREAFGNQYTSTNKIEDYNYQQNVLIMNKDLIETRLRNLDLQIPINILKKLLGCLNNTYRESFLK